MIRGLLSLLLAAAISLQPASAHSADDAVQRIGFVDPANLTPRGTSDSLWARLRELGWEEGRNLVIERRSAEGQYNRLPAIMADLVARKVDVLVTYSTAAGLAARGATRTVPIVDAAMGDPVRDGLASSLARPGGNLTGLSFGWSIGFGGKFLELLQEAVPRVSTVAMITNPENPFERAMVKEVLAAAELRKLKLRVIQLRDRDSIQATLEEAQRQGKALLIFGDPVLYSRRQEIAAFTRQHRFPALYGMREFVEAGGMMAYGPDLTAAWRRAAEYVDKILRGANPAELPIEQPTQYSLTVNLPAARAIGIAIPESILVRAEVLR